MPDDPSSEVDRLIRRVGSMPINAIRRSPAKPIGPLAPTTRTERTAVTPVPLNVIQVSRSDLVTWLSGAEDSYTSQILRVKWTNESGDIFFSPDAPNAPRLAHIEQVEDVLYISHSITYKDNSTLFFTLQQGGPLLSYRAKDENSSAQSHAYRIRNALDESEAPKRPRLPTRLLLRLGLAAAVGGIVGGAALALIVLSDGISEGLKVYLGTVVGVLIGVPLGLFHARTYTRFFRRESWKIVPPLVISYPKRTRWYQSAVFYVAVGVATILAALFGFIAIIPILTK